jgi:exopolyphosphatase/guanosine-5'-triphosphate,3'-diphosphate pyrophosphatase
MSRSAMNEPPEREPVRDSESVAAVDLGSNSFHMVVGRVVGDSHFHIVDRLRERVALAAGFDARNNLTERAQERALACLERFGQRLRELPEGRVRAVGTSAMRQASNARAFVDRAQAALGHPIEIIAGSEEARLIYLGVAHTLADDRGRRLVIDIGGGSTELIVGERFEPIRMDSLGMGCVGYSLRFFPDGKIRAEDFRKAEIAARLKLEPIERRYLEANWENCVGASGTITAVDAILRANGWSDRGITMAGLRPLKKALIAAGSTNKVAALPGVQADRAPVLPGGVAILMALFEALKIERMAISTGSMREGLLYDLLGRIRHEDVRDQTIRQLCQRYNVDMAQAGRVERLALHCFDQVSGPWGLDPALGHQLLGWAARLHEIGLSLAYSGYHKHSAYLVANSDMPGFSREDQALLAAMLLGQRKRLTREVFAGLPSSEVELARGLTICLRVAIRLARSRSPTPLPPFTATARRNGLELGFLPDWIEAHPLTRADLVEEAAKLREIGFELRVR